MEMVAEIQHEARGRVLLTLVWPPFHNTDVRLVSHQDKVQRYRHWTKQSYCRFYTVQVAILYCARAVPSQVRKGIGSLSTRLSTASFGNTKRTSTSSLAVPGSREECPASGTM